MGQMTGELIRPVKGMIESVANDVNAEDVG